MPNYRRGNWIPGAAYRGSVYARATNAKLRAILIANTQYPLIAGSVERLKEQFQHRMEFVAEEATFTTGVTEFYEADLLITFGANGTTSCDSSRSIRTIFQYTRRNSTH